MTTTMTIDARYARIRKLEVELAGLGYHVVTAITVEDVKLRLDDRADGLRADGLLPEQVKAQQKIDSDSDFDTLNYIALQASSILGENHLDILPIDDAIDEATAAKAQELQGHG